MTPDQHALPDDRRDWAVPIAALPRRRKALLSAQRLQQAVLVLPLAATCYSAALAFLIARGFPGSTALVVLIELMLLSGCAFVCLASGLTGRDWAPILLAYGFVVTAVIISMMNGRFMVETLRAGAIISLFVMVGQRMSYRTLDRLFALLFLVVLVFLLIEVVSLPTYVSLLQPGTFFSETRGIATSEFNSSGLFNTATSYQGRFSFGLFGGPRTSSIFLEQISNANFACIGALYLAVRGRMIPKLLLLLGLGTVLLILVSANSRFGSMLVLLTIVGYAIFPLLPRKTLPLGSLAIFAGALVIILHNINAQGDDLQSRIAFVGRKFQEANLPFYLGLDAEQAVGEYDSGYTFFIGTTSIFGMIMLWIFVNFAPRMDDGPSRRLGWGLVFYFLGQLLVSSTSLLSIKTAALLWTLVGCVRAHGGVDHAPRQVSEA